MMSRSKSDWFNSYHKVHDSTLFCCPLPSLSPDTHHPPPSSTAPAKSPVARARQSGKQYPLYYRTSSHICLLSRGKDRENRCTHIQHGACTRAHTHAHIHTHNPGSRYLRFEIINANRAAAHRGGGGRETKGQLLHENRRETSKEKQRGERKCVAWTKIFRPGGGNFILLTLYHLFVIQRAIKIPWRAGGMGGGLMWEKLKAKKTGRQNSEWMWLGVHREWREKYETPQNLILSFFFLFVCLKCERECVCKKVCSVTTTNYTQLGLRSIYKRHFMWVMTCKWQRVYKTSDWRRSYITLVVCPHMLSANL